MKLTTRMFVEPFYQMRPLRRLFLSALLVGMALVVPGQRSALAAAGPPADLAITNTPAAGISGGIATYTLVMTNNGPSDAGLSIEDEPDSATFVSASTTNGSCYFYPASPYHPDWAICDTQTNVPSGGSVTVVVRWQIKQAAVGCVNHTNKATTASYVYGSGVFVHPDPNWSNNTSSASVTACSVPNVIGYPPDEAKTTLASAGFAVSTQGRIDPSCTYLGDVMAQNPSGGTLLSPGTTVTIWVGRPPPKPCP